MNIKQFEYKPLSHFSYAIISENKMALVDPERDPSQYYAYAEAHNATIVAVFETHPHADFVSSHLQIYKETGAMIYASAKTGADYPHQAFDDGAKVTMGGITFEALNTPGHSPDSITIVATEGNATALFTGDTLFVGDVGRPDLREKVGHMHAKRQELASAMYHTIQHTMLSLPDDALVYPAHGAGSLCGKGMSADATSSTLGNERHSNWAFKKQTEQQFVAHLLDGQPFIPHYFGFNVDGNKSGAQNLRESLGSISLRLYVTHLVSDALIVDVRDEASFKKGHLRGSINIMATSPTSKFETWLGSILKPEEKFYIVAASAEEGYAMCDRAAKIGYEVNIKGVLTLSSQTLETSQAFHINDFKANTDNYTIVDIRNDSEVAEGKIFKDAIAIPLHQLREKAVTIPTHKPIVVHCAAGYRSAAGSSILERELQNVTVLDLSDHIKDFK